MNFVQMEKLEEKYFIIAGVEFTHEKLLNLCVHSIKEEPTEGKKYFEDFLLFVTEEYERIGDIYQDNIEADVDIALRAYELRRYIRDKIVHDLLFSMFKYMSQEISQVPLPLTLTNSYSLLTMTHSWRR